MAYNSRESYLLSQLERSVSLDRIEAQADSYHELITADDTTRIIGGELVGIAQETLNAVVGDNSAVFVTAAYGFAYGEGGTKSPSRSLVPDLVFFASLPTKVEPMYFAQDSMAPSPHDILSDGLGIVVSPLKEEDFGELEQLAAFNRNFFNATAIGLPLNRNLVTLTPVLNSLD